MFKILRRLIFFSFLAVFLIGAPKIVFYALGYSYNSGGKKLIQKTGLVYLSTTPPGATVYVGGRRYHDLTPAIIRDLLPGNYPIRIVLKDHITWSKTVPVEAAKASVIGKILLRPKKPDWRRLTQERFEDIISVPETKYLLLRKSKAISDLLVYDRREKKATPLFLENSADNFKLSEIYSVSGSACVLVEAESNSERKWAWIDLDKLERSKIIWEKIFPFKPEVVTWSAKENRFLFAAHDNLLVRFDMEKKALTEIQKDIKGFGVKERKLLMITHENFISTDFLDKNRRLLLKNPARFQSLVGNKNFFEVKYPADDIIFMLGDKGRLIADGNGLAEKDVRGFHFDKKHHKAVIWTENAIGIADFSKEENEWQTGRINWILKQAASISSAFWVNDGAYIIFQDQNRVLLMEEEAFGEPVLYDLLETKNKSQIFYSDESGELFYLDKNAGHLMSLEVVPKWNVLEVPFSLLREKEKESAA